MKMTDIACPSFIFYFAESMPVTALIFSRTELRICADNATLHIGYLKNQKQKG